MWQVVVQRGRGRWSRCGNKEFPTPGLCREARVVVGQCGIEESATGSSFHVFFFQKHKLELPGIIVPPPTPGHLYEQLSSESLPLWNQFDMLPQDLLKE